VDIGPDREGDGAADGSGVWEAPGRVNLIGEHTDYNQGFVLPIALGQTTRAAVTVRTDRRLRLASAQADGPVEVELDDLRPGSVVGWAAYVAGVVWAMRADGYDVPGLDVAIDSSVPVGAGLSSSAALECAVAVAVDDLAGLGLGRHRLAVLAQRAENDFAGVPTGGMDQRASLLCTAGHALLLDCRTDDTEQVPFDPDASGLHLLVVDTRAHHALADGQYAARREECARACAALGVASLRDAEPEAVERLADPLLRRRARHVVTENARVLEVVDLLRAGRTADLGAVLTRSHASLRDDYEVSATELDVAVDAALGAGALGARMTGGGFGGSAIALVEDPERVGAAVAAAFARHGFGAPSVFPVVPGDGARRLAH
jgi:galactokinase